MIFLILAQVLRAALIWTTGYTAKRVTKTFICMFVTCYLLERLKRQNYIDNKRGYNTDPEPRSIGNENRQVPQQ